jgi:hypothetical protein
MEHYDKIIKLIEENKIYDAKKIFMIYVLRPSQMSTLVHRSFQRNKDMVGKEIIKFNFVINNQGFKYNYSPFDFFCYICKNEDLEILFKIIEDDYFWNKDKVIFEPEYNQTPRQWLISTAGFIMCQLNKIKSLEILCEKYKITKFDAQESQFFYIADKNKFEDLFTFLVMRYGKETIEYNIVRETSLYDLPIFPKRMPSTDNIIYTVTNSNTNNTNNTKNLIRPVQNPMYLEPINNRDKSVSLNNPMYLELNKKS